MSIDNTSQRTPFDLQGVKKYVALLTQTGTDAPVATVLQKYDRRNFHMGTDERGNLHGYSKQRDLCS